MRLSNINVKYVLAVLSASVGSGFQYGYNYGLINMADSTIQEWIQENKIERYKKHPSDSKFTWVIVVSIFSIGGMLGSSMTAYFSKRFGHKGGLLWNNVIMFLAGFFLFFAKTAKLFEVFIIGRFLVGIHAGLNSGLCPIYLAEIAPVDLRGSTTAMYSFVLTVSFSFSQIFSIEETLGNKDYWPYLFGITTIPAFIQFFALWMCPESPRFLLITLNDEEKTKEALVWFRNTEGIFSEMDMLNEHRRILKQLPEVTMKTLFSDSIYRTPLLITLAMVVCQQCCGIECALYYSASLLEGVGLTKKEADLSTIIMGVLLVVMTFVCVLLIDVVGRRLLFLLSLVGLIVDSVFLVVVVELSKDDVVRHLTDYSIGTAVVLFTAWYALGTGTIPLVVTVELFHHLARPLAVSVVVPISWLTSFIVNITYYVMLEPLGVYIFVVYMFMDLILFLFIHMYLPETKGHTSKEIISLFCNLDNDETRDSRQPRSTY